MSSNEAPGDAVQIGVVTDQNNALTGGILSLALGLTALMGGGTLATAFQYWYYEIFTGGPTAEVPGFFIQTIGALPPILLGIMAIGLGVVAARSSDAVATATGKAGVALGILAVFGGVLMAVALQSSGPF